MCVLQVDFEAVHPFRTHNYIGVTNTVLIKRINSVSSQIHAWRNAIPIQHKNIFPNLQHTIWSVIQLNLKLMAQLNDIWWWYAPILHGNVITDGFQSATLPMACDPQPTCDARDVSIVTLLLCTCKLPSGNSVDTNSQCDYISPVAHYFLTSIYIHNERIY